METPAPLPFEVRMELPGWCLLWARLQADEPSSSALNERRQQVAAAARESFHDTTAISSHPTVAALRTLFRAAGCDPTRYRPASEALLRRLVKGDPLPAIHPLVDINNCLSAQLAVPCCVMAEATFGDRLVWRSGLQGESYLSLRGPFNAEGKPVLADDRGPVDTPITGSRRVMVEPRTRSAWLVAYLPAAALDVARARAALEEIRQGTGVAAEHFQASA